MTDFSAAQKTLASYFKKYLPSVHAAGTQLELLNDDILVMSAPLTDNHTEQGVAYGGSLYQLAMTACWSALYLKCVEQLPKPNILTRDGQIRYRHPCSENPLKATCKLPNARQWDGFFAHFEKTGKTSLTLTSTIMNGNEVSAYFDGVFVLLDEEH